MASTCIVFVHLPKTAGWTLRATLRYKYPSRTLFLYNTPDPLETIQAVPLTDRREARVVSGHVPVGIDRHIPQPCEYITLLREPVERVVSTYHYVRTHPKHRFPHRDGLAHSGMGLEEFVRVGQDPALENLQTRLLSGKEWGEVRELGPGRREWLAPELGPEDLEAAKRNLDRFLVVGLTERFDETFILVRRALGWKLPMYETHNVAKAPERREPPSQAALELIRERNRMDLELYDHAGRLFRESVAREGASFRREVAAFRFINRLPNTVGPHIPRRLRHPLRALLPR